MDESVTVTAVYAVAYGRETDFFTWLDMLFGQAESSDDFLGSGLLGPPEPGGEWHVIYRWADQESAQLWVEHVTGPGWHDHADDFCRAVQIQWTTGMREWFEGREEALEVTGPAAGPPTPPPKWKMAVVTLTAVFPPVLLFNVSVIPRLLGLPTVLRTLVLCVGVTAAVTWVMMPRLMPLFKGWLHPALREPPRPSGRHIAAGGSWWSALPGPNPRERPPAGGTGRRVVVPLRNEDADRTPAPQPSRRDSRSSYLRSETG